MVIPGSTIKVCLTGKDQRAADADFFFTVLDAAGSPAISDGYLRLQNERRTS
jgi:hypothetical protein